MKGEVVKKVIAAHGFTQQEVADRIGKTLANLSAQLGKDDIRTGLLEDISKATDIPVHEFLGGKKTHFVLDSRTLDEAYALIGKRRAESPIQANTVPLLPIFAQAGHLTGWSESVTEVECERVISPVKNIDMAVHIYGESMYPDIPNGSVAYVRKVSGRIIDWGKAYILDTVDGPLVKYITPGEDEEHIKCVSANHDPKYAPIEVAKQDVIGLYRVVMCMKMM